MPLPLSEASPHEASPHSDFFQGRNLFSIMHAQRTYGRTTIRPGVKTSYYVHAYVSNESGESNKVGEGGGRRASVNLFLTVCCLP